MWTVIWIEQISTSGCFVDFELYWIFRCVAFKPLGLLALSRDVNVNQNTLFIGPVIQIRFFLGTILFLLHRYHNLTENRASSVFLKITLSAMAWYRLKYFYTNSIPTPWLQFQCRELCFYKRLHQTCTRWAQSLGITSRQPVTKALLDLCCMLIGSLALRR